MIVRNWVVKLDSFKYIVDKMEFSSYVGKSQFLNREFSCDSEVINKWLGWQERFWVVVERENRNEVERLRHYISEINDVRVSLNSICGGSVISEPELFEVKKVAYYAAKIASQLELLGYCDIVIDNLNEVFELLDPQRSGILSFYIYDDYSPKLRELRELLKNASEQDKEKLFYDIDNEQIKVLADLTNRLKPSVELIRGVIESIADLDFVVASTYLYREYGMCRANIVSKGCSISQMFNPLVSDRLKTKGIDFQKVNIAIEDAPTLICGANMSGKSVVLNTVALCQLLVQFGMYVPSDTADVSLKDDVLLSLTDESSLQSGLSSFAKEILNIDEMIKMVEQGANPLILIDEAARTTNPVEGVAIVSALIEIFEQRGVSALITTHYSGISHSCKCLRVKGVKRTNIDEKITVSNINRYIDYSLEEVESSDAPQEAIMIAELLGVSSDFIEKTKKYINK